MKLYKFRPLGTCKDYERVSSILNNGFYCCDFLDFNDFNEGVFPISKNTSKVTLDLKLEYRICSFSAEEALKSQLMWGHYANAGMGIAIEIDARSALNYFKIVNYGHAQDHEYAAVEQILTNKAKEWEHEKEWRYLSTNEKKYYKHKIEKIYFGAPYAHLANSGEIKTKHRKLRNYLKYADWLRKECCHKKIPCCDNKFP